MLSPVKDTMVSGHGFDDALALLVAELVLEEPDLDERHWGPPPSFACFLGG
jgi:hypothetical protein